MFLEPVERECGEYLILNGDKVFEKCQLYNQDRLILGSNSAFLIIIPNGDVRPGFENLPKAIDWEFA